MARKNMIDPEVLNTYPGLSREDALASALSVIEDEKFDVKQPARERLIRDLNAARSSVDICGIMYRIYLAGTGLRTVNSSWNKMYNK